MQVSPQMEAPIRQALNPSPNQIQYRMNGQSVVQNFNVFGIPVPNHGQMIPNHRQMVPNHGQMVPNYRQIAPKPRQMVPNHRVVNGQLVPNPPVLNLPNNLENIVSNYR